VRNIVDPVEIPSLGALLRLQQLADSSLPIGGAAHSFGIESLVDARLLSADSIEIFLGDYLKEAGALEASYCISSCNLARDSVQHDMIPEWLRCNTELAARKLSRESREASAAMGRRFLNLSARISGLELLLQASDAVRESGAEVHLAPCFGLAAGSLGLDARIAATAYLQQSITTLLGCCQRLLPVGQTRAQEILWALEPHKLHAVERGSAFPAARASSFTPLVDVMSCRHANLYTRLFIS